MQSEDFMRVSFVLLVALSPAAGNPQSASTKDVQASLVEVPDEVPKDAARYSVLFAGNKAGILALWRTADDARHSFFQFNDRGRGPRTLSRETVDAKGVPLSLEITGHDYLNLPIDEHFTSDGRKAGWKNHGEHGEKVMDGPAYYPGFSADPSDLAGLARALLANSRSLALLPEGTAHLTSVGERTVGSVGGRVDVAGYEITGLDYSPTPVWLTKEGELFAVGSAWSAVVRQGFEGEWEALRAAQERRAAERGATLVAKAVQKSDGPLVFVHARLFDSEKATSLPDMTVVISGNHIAAVGKGIPIPPKARVVDAGGKALLPGLWDMHVHLQESDGVLHMAAGVTSVRDLANDVDLVGTLKRRYASLELVGPRVINAGFVDGRGPYQGPTKVFADTAAEALAVIEKYKSLSYEQIKVYSSLKPELVPGIAAEAHKRGMRLSGHVPAFMKAEDFIRAGADEIQHINFIVLNFFFDEVKDTRTPARFTEVAERAAELDLDSPRVKAFVNLMLEHHTVLDPTVSIFEEMFLSRPGEMGPVMAPVAKRLPAQVRRGYLADGLPVPEGKDQRYRDSAAALLKLVKRLHDSGVVLVAGTDSVPGFTLHRELAYYVEAGIPAPTVLQLATIGAARVMKHEDELGSVAPGKLADLILVDGDPATHIEDIRRVVTVVKDGVVYDPAVLYESAGVTPR